MPTAEKERTIEQAKEWYSKSVGLVFTDYRGLKVQEFQQLRSDLKQKGGEMHVIKNTLLRLAVGDLANELPEEMHNGPTAVAFVYENESDCTKALVDYAKSNKNLKVKGGYFAGKVFDTGEVEALAKLPPRDVLIAQVIGAIAAPLSNLVGVVEALYADPIRTIGAVADKVAEGSPVPEAKAEEAPAAEAPAEEAQAEAPTEEPKAEAAAEEPKAEAAAEEAPEAETKAEEPAAEASTDDTNSSEEAPAEEAASDDDNAEKTE